MSPSSQAAILRDGASVIAQRLVGFAQGPIVEAAGSGGPSASCEFISGHKRLELHFRAGLGLVRYHIGPVSLSHEEYMELKGVRDEAAYPGFPKLPLDSFVHLAQDIERFATDFASGDGRELIELQKLRRPVDPRRNLR